MRRYVVRTSNIHGQGVFANTHLPAHTKLMQYEGERISSAEAVLRYGDNTSVGSTYLFAVNADWLIDGLVGGNSARFINHSCAPNCEAVIWVDINGDSRKDKVWIETLRDVEIGEELTFDYALELNSATQHPDLKAWQCRCGQPNCRGSMLAG